MSRARSPKYPSLTLDQAIDTVKEIHNKERTNSIDRDVAAQALGYSGISGRSATVLAGLNQYGLLRRSGKNEVQVTDRAVEILYPDSPETKFHALQDAAREPELFQRIFERFPDGTPSENALKAFLVKEGFTNAAIPAAIKAFQETFLFLENEGGYERNLIADNSPLESTENQQVVDFPMYQNSNTKPQSQNFLEVAGGVGASIQFANKRIALSGVIETREQADELIATINALKNMLRSEEATKGNVAGSEEFDD